jgi:hypothetical protein
VSPIDERQAGSYLSGVSGDHNPAANPGDPMDLTTERKKLCHSIFVTALEGGVGYWSSCSEYHWALKSVDGDLTDDLTDDLDGFYAIIREDENQDEDGKVPKHRIDAEVIDRGINRIANGTATYGGKRLTGNSVLYKLACALNGPLAEEVDFDADDADNIVQIGLFGDVMYG